MRYAQCIQVGAATVVSTEPGFLYSVTLTHSAGGADLSATIRESIVGTILAVLKAPAAVDCRHFVFDPPLRFSSLFIAVSDSTFNKGYVSYGH